MTYSELLQQLHTEEYFRVERDDRLLDVFPIETREKGVELWEKMDEDQGEIKILRVRLPYEAKKLKLYVLAKAQLDFLLQENNQAQLKDFELVAEGEEVQDQF